MGYPIGAFALLLIGMALPAAAESGFSLRNPYPSTGVLDLVYWTQGRFYAKFIGNPGWEPGDRFKSEDGIQWTLTSNQSMPGKDPAFDPGLPSIIRTDSLFVKLDSSGAILGSADSLAWSVLRSGSGKRIRSLAWTGSQLVAVGDGGLVLTSPEGKFWTTRDPGNAYGFVFTHWTGSVIAAIDDHAELLMSPDGIAWSLLAPPSPCEIRSASEYSVQESYAWTGSRFVAFCQQGGNILVTEDFSAWKTDSSAATGWLLGLFRKGNRFLVRHENGLRFSDGGGTWKPLDAGLPGTIKSLIRSDGRYIARDDRENFAYSDSGNEWTSRKRQGTLANLRAVAWTGKVFAAVGDSGTILTSPDGLDWKQVVTRTKMSLSDIVFAANRVVALGSEEQSHQTVILGSSDGLDWDSPDTLDGVLLNRIAWDGNRFLAVGSPAQDGANLFTSTDGKQWTESAVSGLDRVNLLAIAKAGNLYVSPGILCGHPSCYAWIYTSQDGSNWKQLTSPYDYRYSSSGAVVYNGQKTFVMGGGQVYASADGASWNSAGPSGATLYGLAWIGQRLIGVGTRYDFVASTPAVAKYSAAITASYDGTAWDTIPTTGTLWPSDSPDLATVVPGTLRALATDGTHLVAVGDRGLILQSSDPTINVSHTLPSRTDLRLTITNGRVKARLPFPCARLVRIAVYSPMGKRYDSPVAIIGANELDLDLTALRPGLYLLVLEGAGQRIVTKFNLMR